MKNEKIVSALREHAEWARAKEWETPITLGDDLAEAADVIEKLRGQVPHWIPVTERLPEETGKQRGFYLVALSNGVVKELAYEFEHYDNMLFDVGWHETAYPVTHWMPLPEPPEENGIKLREIFKF